jgi:hypothetical protein
MRLNQLFMATTGVLLALVSGMLALSMLIDWRIVSAARQGLQAIDLTHQAIKVAELSSFERGPSNAVLGDGEPPDPSKSQRLVMVRESSDKAYDAVRSVLSPSTNPVHLAALAAINSSRERLIAARKEVDRVAALPLARRMEDGGQATSATIGLMFLVVDAALDAVTFLSNG